ncbi:MAG: site-specific integrase [Bacteroidales bacterium]|nr:site-specific integrase [Bacteroidales bacterium]
MAKITRTISKRIVDGKAEIMLRLTISRAKQIRLKSGVMVNPDRFKDGRIVYPRANQREISLLRDIEKRLDTIESMILDLAIANPDVTKDAISLAIDKHLHPDSYASSTDGFFDLWNRFIAHHDISANRKSAYRAVARTLHRYECWRRITRRDGFSLDIHTIASEDIEDFERFLPQEYRLADAFPKIYREYPVEIRPQRHTQHPSRRGRNIIVTTIKRIKAFMNWCVAEGLTDNHPFDTYHPHTKESYGTPFYLTTEERDQLAAHDFSTRPALGVQRDIFIVQCYIGCRVSDLTRLTSDNIVGDFVEYIPMKTKRERQDVVRVPLHPKAKAIIERYQDSSGDRLLPFISDQKYNKAIKEMCREAGLDRMVTVINSITGEDERKPIWQVATSHMARRTFVGNLYRKVKDPNLIGSMSGHAEGSRAFARYRDIDDDIKRDTINLLD